ncbi:phosphoribosylanthranilate isomerase [Candidatus Peregrinibacteria bacterium]|nr:phosphoribosylanthranilate isomerase [Candidatus Peregrinibacteria bacterium]
MKIKVKFCGMTRREDIEAAQKLNVDFLGFVFVTTSPRCVTLAQAKQLRAIANKANVVGVFEQHSVDEIEEHIRMLTLDFVQLYGEPNIGIALRMSVPVIQAFRGIPDRRVLDDYFSHSVHVLIDKAENHEEADCDFIASLPLHIRSKLFLAGGLTPENVRIAVDQIEPFAVDCARGIESEPGIKDHDRMIAFLHALSP